MTSKCSLFVDAGYLLASSASRLTGTSLRSGIHVKYRRLIRGLIKAAEDTTGLPVLRVHWYDSAKDGVPDRSQERIGELPKVKLRLGRFGYDGQQKGVDLRLGLDMVTHAHHKAAEVFLLVSGDDDLTEAVEDVQVHGVQVLVLAVPGVDGQPHGVSRHLVRAADEIVTLDPLIIDEAIIPIETPEQAKDDSIELPHGNSELLLLKPRVPVDDLALIADAMVFGNSGIPGRTGSLQLPLHDDALPDAQLGHELEIPGVTGAHAEDLIDLNEIEVILSAAHLDQNAQDTEQVAAAETAAEHFEIEAVPGEVSDMSSGAEPAPSSSRPVFTMPKPGPRAATLPQHEVVERDHDEAPEQPGSEADADSSVDHGSVTLDSVAHDSVAHDSGSSDAGVVTDALNRLMRPTPRDVSSSIGRPAERPFRPTYSSGPENPNKGTWAHQWSEVIESVVGRVLNSLTKSTTVDTWNVIGLGRPSIPQEIDKALLLDATEAMGVYTLSDAERHEVRAAFWREFDQIVR